MDRIDGVSPAASECDTVLPTGEVLVTGGTSGTGFNDLTAAVHAAEIWNPATGIWTTLASNAVNRGYHATSHPAARWAGPAHRERRRLGDAQTSATRSFSRRLPLQGLAPRPLPAPRWWGTAPLHRHDPPAAHCQGEPDPPRLGTTHAFDMNQRFQSAFSPGTRGPDRHGSDEPNRDSSRPLHALHPRRQRRTFGGGHPRIGTDAEIQPPPDAPPTAAFSPSCSRLSCIFTDRSTDSDGVVTAWGWSFGDGGSSTLPSPSHTFVNAGSYAITLTATDDVGATKQISGSVAVSQAIC